MQKKIIHYITTLLLQSIARNTWLRCILDNQSIWLNLGQSEEALRLQLRTSEYNAMLCYNKGFLPRMLSEMLRPPRRRFGKILPLFDSHIVPIAPLLQTSAATSRKLRTLLARAFPNGAWLSTKALLCYVYVHSWVEDGLDSAHRFTNMIILIMIITMNLPHSTGLRIWSVMILLRIPGLQV